MLTPSSLPADELSLSTQVFAGQVCIPGLGVQLVEESYPPFSEAGVVRPGCLSVTEPCHHTRSLMFRNSGARVQLRRPVCRYFVPACCPAAQTRPPGHGEPSSSSGPASASASGEGHSHASQQHSAHFERVGPSSRASSSSSRLDLTSVVTELPPETPFEFVTFDVARGPVAHSLPHCQGPEEAVSLAIRDAPFPQLQTGCALTFMRLVFHFSRRCF